MNNELLPSDERRQWNRLSICPIYEQDVTVPGQTSKLSDVLGMFFEVESLKKFFSVGIAIGANLSLYIWALVAFPVK